MTRAAFVAELRRKPPAAVARLGTVVLSHPVLDAYSGFVPPLLGVLQVRCDLTYQQAALLLSIGPLTSGLCQPAFAWLTDHVDSRIFGAAGLAVAAAALSCIGLADSFPTLVVLFVLGMLGVGAFHPVAAASVGQMAGRRRSMGVTLFFVAGMVGAAMGPIISTRVTAIEPNGFALLRWVMIPGLITAVLLHLAIRNVPHKHDHEHVADMPRAEARQRWTAVMLLWAGNAMRFWVNIALLYLFVRWTEAVVVREQPLLDASRVPVVGSILCGEMNALMMLGMGVGGFAAGMLVRHGRERLAFVLVPLLLGPAIALFPLCGRWGGYGLALLAGVAYASVIPLAISVAQRLLPHRTSLASSLMMGGGWAMAALAPPVMEWIRREHGLPTAFHVVAVVLVASGIVGMALPAPLLRRLG
ncbi:MAG: MFS transporter [Planctomycetes bacterium]|nr:MFS transporter [Planctomycetota bacterium]